jgi:alpha-L-rhamnosidase
MWSTGPVVSNETVGILYDGAPLSSEQEVVWTVRVADQSGAWSEWSPPARWTMGLLSHADWSGAQWIARDNSPAPTNISAFYDDHPAPLFRRVFEVDSSQPYRVRLSVSGLGYYRLYVDGEPVELQAGDTALAPGLTTYAQRVLYHTYDLTPVIERAGGTMHCLGLELGRGWFSPLPLLM